MRRVLWTQPVAGIAERWCSLAQDRLAGFLVRGQCRAHQQAKLLLGG